MYVDLRRGHYCWRVDDPKRVTLAHQTPYLLLHDVGQAAHQVQRRLVVLSNSSLMREIRTLDELKLGRKSA